MHTVIRRYKNASKLIAELERKPNEVEQLITTVPGFVAYHAVRDGDTLVTLTTCRDKDGTAETTRRAADWVRANLPADALVTPEITAGDTFLHFSAAESMATQARLNDTMGSRPAAEGANIRR
jgi:hypothetical protein